MRIYLDYNATTPMDRRVLEAMLPYFTEKFGNPSSIHTSGREAKVAIEDARAKVANLLGAEPEEIIFTSGGTEADNLAIKGIAFARKEGHIITSSIEHHAVLNAVKWLEKRGFEVTYLPVDEYGIIDPDDVRKAIKKETILITIMFANNEVGTIEPVQEISEIAREKGIPFHTDAVQAVGKIPLNVKELGVDMLSLSGHKFYGPKGIGALYRKRGMKVEPLFHGGEHEKRMRAGTENVPGIVGLGEAAQIALAEMEEEENRIRKLRDKLEEGIAEKIPEVIILGHPEKRLFNTLGICVKYVEGESILLQLDFEGIEVSSGSACTSGSLEPSHVLLAMGLPHEIAHGSIRFSLGKGNTEKDIDRVLDVMPPIVEKLRAMSPFWKK